ncbi:MAG: AzlC family ABC transporter permease [Eubacteriales bacterium]|nr:AzlC family ABC transporter permease [Eubacteriales bacterium]
MRYAFPFTVPILLGYGFMGMAFGILLSKLGYGVPWAVLMAVTIFGGSMQFVALGLLSMSYDPLACVMLTLTVNCRYMFYGISLLDKYGDFRWLKPYMIHTITDETYSIQCTARILPDIDEKAFRLAVAGLNHLYWIGGCTIGALLGDRIPFDTTGIDFTMTALFIVIAVDQWQSVKRHLPAVIGFIVPLICLPIFGRAYFVAVSMVGIIVALFIFKPQIQKGGDDYETAV